MTEETEENKKITTLILSGGGIKGFAIIGALKALKDLGFLTYIDTVCGSSIGAIIGTLFLMNIDCEKIFEVLNKIDFKKLSKINFGNFLSKFGLDEGNKFMIPVKKLFEYAGFSENITLKEFYEKTNKKIIITASCLNDKKCYYLSYETFPNLELIKALRMSMGVPLYYTVEEYDNKLFIDGGCLDNFPIELYKNDLDKIIGINIDYPDVVVDKIDTIEAYIINLFYLFTKNKKINDIYNDKYVTIYINNTNPIDFNINNDKKKELHDIGYDTTIIKFKK